MKRTCITFLLLIIIIVTVACGSGTNVSADRSVYLRMHIRANSNSEEDQRVKYLVRDAVVACLTPIVADCTSKEQVAERISAKKRSIEYVADEILSSNGFSYKSELKIDSELFPTRIYEDLTLEGGYYDAVILGLGEAKGDNWWCVVYPPLCFTSGENVRYRSKIIELIEEFKKRRNGG